MMLEKKARPMTNAEMRGFIANTPGIEMHYKRWADNVWMPFCIIKSDVPSEDFIGENPVDWTYRTISLTGEVGELQKLEVKE